MTTCRCFMFQTHGICWHTGYDPRRSIAEQTMTRNRLRVRLEEDRLEISPKTDPATPRGNAMTCAFCAIARHDRRRQIESVLDVSFVITPLDPVTPGHKLVIPFEHAEDATTTPGLTARVMSDVAYYLARDPASGPCNIITSVGVEATQTIFHLHFHIIPRRAGDGLALPWTGQRRQMRPIADRHSDQYDPPPSARIGGQPMDPDDVPRPEDVT